MILLPDGRILLSGGATVDEKRTLPTYHRDLRQLDTETMLWSKAKTEGGAYVRSGLLFLYVVYHT